MGNEEGTATLWGSAFSWILANLDNLLLTALSVLVGVFIAWVFYRKGLGSREVRYQLTRYRLIGYDRQRLPNDVEIRYKGNPVSRLDRTVLVIWNSGRPTVDGSDIVLADPLRIVVYNSQILDAKVLVASRDVVGCQVAFTGREDGGQIRAEKATVKFDYLDHADGMVIEVLHAPNDSLAGDSATEDTAAKNKKSVVEPELLGSVKGIPLGLKKVEWGAGTSLFDEFMQVAGAAMMALFFGIVANLRAEQRGLEFVSIALSVASVALFGGAVVLLYRAIRIVKERPPKLLRSIFVASR